MLGGHAKNSHFKTHSMTLPPPPLPTPSDKAAVFFIEFFNLQCYNFMFFGDNYITIRNVLK